MKSSFILALLCTTLAHAAVAIDLSPRFMVTDGDGIKIRRPYFADGDRKFAITIDRETELLDYEGSALFNFRGYARAAMRLRPSPLEATLPFDALNVARYREAALAMLIQGAEKAVIENELTNVLPINEWQSLRFIVTYELTGSKMRETITFLNLESQKQIVFQIRAKESDFAVVAARGEDIMRRWHEVLPGSEVAGN